MPGVAGHGGDGRHLFALFAPGPHEDGAVLDGGGGGGVFGRRRDGHRIGQLADDDKDGAGVVDEAADVGRDGRAARRRRTRVAPVEAETFQEAAQRDVVAAVKVHVDRPRRHAVVRRAGRRRTVRREQNAQPLRLRVPKEIDCFICHHRPTVTATVHRLFLPGKGRDSPLGRRSTSPRRRLC